VASLRKRYQERFQDRRDEELPPVTTAREAPQVAALPPATDKPAAEPLAIETSPADQAALRSRIAEIERAEELARQAQPQQQSQPQYATEPPQTEVPIAVQRWLHANPKYQSDPVAQAELNVASLKCRRDGVMWDDENFIPALERHLGNGHAKPAAPAPVAPRVAPVRQSTVPVSAPPTREVASWTTGRPQSEPVQLNEEQRQLARTLGISDEEYRQGLARMNREKAGGLHNSNG
jgi:hypothetical protein